LRSGPARTRILRRVSLATGWLVDRRVPTLLRAPLYRAYCRFAGADPGEAELSLRGYPSLGAFFVRRLRAGARQIAAEPDALASPCDGTLAGVEAVRAGSLLQAKGRPYSLAELLEGAEGELSLEGAQTWTIYLAPGDYHRVHAPADGRLVEVRWSAGTRYSVAPKVLAARERVLATNERAVLHLESERGPWFLVMVGALNVGRIRVVGVPPGESPPAGAPPAFRRGDELARFEMGSTVVLVFPAGRARARAGLAEGQKLRLGEPIGKRLP
jgi:phosphatidylserine decarboxylase